MHLKTEIVAFPNTKACKSLAVKNIGKNHDPKNI